jgi:hypothetical protein
VKVELVADGLKFNVLSDRSQFQKLQIGDRVEVTYSQGKYTGTIWGAEIN